MNKDRSNTLNKKDNILMENCLKLLENVEEIIQCPVCFENSDQMEQCISGHLICLKCKEKISTNSCPFCKKIYSGTKSFIMPELSKTLSSLKISLDMLENNCAQKTNNNVESYRNLTKTILTKMSIFLSNTGSTFDILYNYFQNHSNISQKEMEKLLMSLSMEFHNLECYMVDTKEKLISLKE